MRQQAAYLWMQQMFGIGTRRAHSALARYQTPTRLLSMSRAELREDPFLGESERAAILSPDLSRAELLLRLAEENEVSVVTPEHPGYPELLRAIHSPPLALFAQGDLSLLRAPYPIALVGTREPNDYGLRCARVLSGDIAKAGGLVVSGMAMGIDAACHQAALDAGGETVAFLACGIDVDYPAQNAGLRRRIRQNGLLLSEFPFGMRAYPSNFGIRNRLISGMSLAVVVVQAAKRSGSLLTVGHALSQDRDVYAVPGDIFSFRTRGCNLLLGEGAAPALSGTEIVGHYRDIYDHPVDTALQRPTPPPVIGPSAADEPVPDYLDTRQAAVLSLLREGALPVDVLCGRLDMEAPPLLATLTQLEIFGLVQAMPGMVFGLL